MDLTYDFVVEHVNPHLLPENVIRLRSGSKELNQYKILPSHKFVRKLMGVTEVLTFKKNDTDNYELSVSLSENFDIKTFEHLKKILHKNPLYSFSIYYYEKNLGRNSNLFYNTDFNLLLELLYTNPNANNFRYLSMNLNDFWRFADICEKQIIDSNSYSSAGYYLDYTRALIHNEYFKNFDTLLVDFQNWDICDLSHLGYTVLRSYPFIKNIIIDNLCINEMDLNNNFLKTIVEYVDNGSLNVILDENMGVSDACDPEELRYCIDFKYDSDKYPLIKTKYMDLNIYHYDRINYDSVIDQSTINNLIINYLIY